MTEDVDVLLIGGGIMSATLGTLLKDLQPDWKIVVCERLSDVALESSNAWNNAGTGHAALCELNYMPQGPDGKLDPAKAIAINEQFQQSRQLWSTLVEEGVLDAPSTFINATPHMTFVRGEKDVEYLRKRYEVLKKEPLFAGIEYSEDSRVIHQWAPLLMKQRLKSDQPFAATRVPSGTDVDFGALTRQLFAHLKDSGVDVVTNCEVRKLKRQKDGAWLATYRGTVGRTPGSIRAKFVFVGAGGWALKLLQRSGIPEIKGYGVFPIGGQWLKTSNPAIVAQHRAKVYSQASVGAPPMSVPHLDTRVVDGETSLLFGPFATFSPKFLKNGSMLDIVTQVRAHNLWPMLKVAIDNPSLLRYLVGELLKNHAKKVDSLRTFVPTAKDEDWELLNAGQRAQVMKRDPKKGGVLQFGTEVVTAEDGSIAGLLGASPGASTAVSIMLGLLKTCFPDRMPEWEGRLKALIPSYGETLNPRPEVAREITGETAQVLALTA
ncbi:MULTISPECIES: malate:quinone oxidoreductase [Microbacterium]|uniref:Probable malate:quinone oxidoreductase n=1 Tax=Microbacterium wangchenii TaxID=2541726 RepID=A0ABX5STV4_9MICO|nr:MULTISPECIES: malate:quinone oxidoreductase [Microbacterium]MCK6067459.1 malate:quinone oxidoreductase [Microbacterium sp. EYE_512]QBR89606.1 malate:quinone oxidoreductase [Microbacterium wangchenii]TFV80955.1 malate:quinone oxidoreductase [Microbacterium sp. dk485]TXK16795.1 malate:quinone oxidoreductase [Microbacterium wangchenii]